MCDVCVFVNLCVCLGVIFGNLPAEIELFGR